MDKLHKKAMEIIIKDMRKMTNEQIDGLLFFEQDLTKHNNSPKKDCYNDLCTFESDKKCLLPNSQKECPNYKHSPKGESTKRLKQLGEQARKFHSNFMKGI